MELSVDLSTFLKENDLQEYTSAFQGKMYVNVQQCSWLRTLIWTHKAMVMNTDEQMKGMNHMLM